MTRKGTLRKKDSKWIVRFPKYPESNKFFDWKEVPLCSEDQLKVTSNSESIEGKTVHFELIDEFTHPQYYENVSWGDGTELAKIVEI
jgi:hypothetical protein